MAEAPRIDRDSVVGDWLVVPGPPFERMWRWGRIVEVLDDLDPPHYRVRWVGDTHDTVVLPPPEARIEPAADWPEPGSGAFGLYPIHRMPTASPTPGNQPS